jgi:hypothetical protein
MSRYLILALMGLTLASVPMITGCDKDKETEKKDVEVKHADGSKEVDKEKTTTNTQTGATKKTTEHEVTAPTTKP